MTQRLLAGGRVAFGRVALGTLLLTAPEHVLRPLAQRPIGTGERAVARLLGLRNLVEGVVLVRHRSHGRLVAGAAVDATHALSMVALAAVKPEHRRLAAASALTASATGAAALLAAWRER